VPFHSAHTPDVKDRALALAREGVPDDAIAATLQIPVETIAGWRHKARIKPPKPLDDVEPVTVLTDASYVVRSGRSGAIEADNRTGRVLNQKGNW